MIAAAAAVALLAAAALLAATAMLVAVAAAAIVAWQLDRAGVLPLLVSRALPALRRRAWAKTSDGRVMPYEDALKAEEQLFSGRAPGWDER